MAIIKEVRGHSPKLGMNCFLADTAVVIGEVTMGDNCTVWFNAIIRGDVHSITIGNNTNIQDGAVIHCTYQKAKTVIGNNVSIAHNAIVHGCVIEDNVLIGMGAIVMDDAVIGQYIKKRHQALIQKLQISFDRPEGCHPDRADAGSPHR